MSLILYAAQEALSAAVIIVPLTLIFAYFRSAGAKTAVLYSVFALYLAVIYIVTGLPTVTYIRFDASFQLVPLAGIARDIPGNLLNILLFVPIGLLLPLIWEPFKELRYTLLFSAALTLTAELLLILPSAPPI